MESVEGASLIIAPSFEDRSVAGAEAFVEAGGDPESSFVALLTPQGDELEENTGRFSGLGFKRTTEIDRTDSRALWEWTWNSVKRSGSDVIIDATCIPRELLGMILFALSVKRETIERVRAWYTTPERYITQNDLLPKEERWLSRGVKCIRTILGYPGDFASNRRRHVVALVGHELDRLLEIVSSLEPTKLSIGTEQHGSETVAGATSVTAEVKTRLREEVGVPQYGEVAFYSNSVGQTYDSLFQFLHEQRDDENVAIVAMNTKLSFIGAALCALRLRHIRMIYAVPVEYNTHYSQGVQDILDYDITEYVKSAMTTRVGDGSV